MFPVYGFSSIRALEFSDEPERVFRKACMTGFEGIKALSGLLERGLIDVEEAPLPEADAMQRVREELLFRRRLAWIKAAAWAGAGAALLLWIRGMFLSPEASRLFTGWVEFF